MKLFLKRVMPIMLTFIMVFSIIAGMGVSVSADTYSGSCGDDLTWTLDISTGVLNISGTGEMTVFASLRDIPWRIHKPYIKTVKIGDQVTTISKEAFFDCSSITSVSIGKSVVEIGSSAFYFCTSLKSVSIPDSVISMGAFAFSFCNSLTSVSIGNSVTRIEENTFSHCSALTSLKISDSVSVIGDYAFYCCSSLTNVIIPNSVKSIGDNSFSICRALTSVTIPGSVTDIGVGAFLHCPVTIKCCENSYAHTYAVDNEISYELLKEHSFTKYISDNNYTCTADGTKTASCDYGCGATDTITDEGSASHRYTLEEILSEATCMRNGQKLLICDCGASITEDILKVDHRYTNYQYNNDATCTKDGTKTAFCDHGCGETSTVSVENTMIDHEYNETIIQPTTNSTGLYSKECRECGYTETEVIPMLEKPEISVDNYTVNITVADYISAIRFASGEHTTAASIKNATDRVDLSATVINRNTVNGNFEYIMGDGGFYTFWVKLTDGTDYLLYADLTSMNQEIEVNGVAVTLKNLYGVKDYFIAKGDYDNYTDLRDNALVQITQNKIQGARDYTYNLSEPGRYTICVRYTDSTREFSYITFDVAVIEPVFTEDGLQVIIDNLEDLKVIRTAYGEYKTPGEIKRAAGARAFTAKNVNGVYSYTIQYRDEGMVTIAVVYNNGYEVIYKYNVTKKVPEMTQNGNTITFTKLDDLKVIRYAKGEFTTSSQIKNTVGCVALKPNKIVDGKISVTLKSGTYTFCVQYNDESYNYYTVTVE